MSRSALGARIHMRVFVVPIAAILTFAALTPTTRAQATNPQYLFVSQTLPSPATGNGIATYIVDPTTGALTPSGATPVQPRTAVIGQLALNPAGTFLFAASQVAADDTDIGVFTVGADGQLTEIPTSPFGLSQATAAPIAVAVSPNGNYLYVASSYTPPGQQDPAQLNETLVDVLAIAADGSLSVANTFTITPPNTCSPSQPTYATPVGMYLHPAQKWLYVFMSVLSNDSNVACTSQPEAIQQFTIQTDGTLALGAFGALPANSSNAAAITGSPDGSAIFLLNGSTYPANKIAFALEVYQGTGAANVYNEFDYTGDLPLVGARGGAAVDSTSTYLYTPMGTFTFANGIIAPGQLGGNIFANGSELSSPALPLIFGSPATGLVSELVNTDGSLTAAPGSPYAIVPAAPQSYPMVLSGTTPTPNVPVMWISVAENPITVSGVVEGQTSGGGEVNISNQGYAPLPAPAISLTGDPSLSQSSNCSPLIAPGTLCTVTVTFSPTSVGTFTGTLTVGPQSVSISASSIAAGAGVGVVPSSWTFPDQKTGTSSAPLTVTFTNPASAFAPVVPTGITITGAASGDYSQTNNCTAILKQGQSCTANVVFAPQAVGERDASLTLTSSTANYYANSAVLTGNGATNPATYTLAQSPDGDGTITQTPPGTSFTANTLITLTAAADGNKSFFSVWSGVCKGSTAPVCSFLITQNTSGNAIFLPTVAVTSVANGPGTVAVQISFGPVTQNGSLQEYAQLTATPNVGASFTGWSGPCADYGGSPNYPYCNFYPTTNIAITATFVGGPTYTLTSSVLGPGTLYQYPPGITLASGATGPVTTVAPGATVQEEAYPAADAAFIGWSGPCALNPNPYCAFTINANTNVVATFAQKYTLATSVVGTGSVTRSLAGTYFNSGTSITLTATPSSGATFTSWSGACAGSANPVCTFAISANTNAVATFTQQYTLSTAVSGPGTITQSPTGTSFSSGTPITLTAVPNTGDTFTSWSGACAGSTNPVCTFAITANTSATATFTAPPAVTPSQPSQTGGAGSSFMFTINTSGFSAPPTLTASCSIPGGTCTVSGTTLTVTTTARTSRQVHPTASLLTPPAIGGGDPTQFAPAKMTLPATHAYSEFSFAEAQRRLAPLRLPLLVLAAIFAMCLMLPSTRGRRTLSSAALVGCLALLAACGGGGGGGGTVTGTPAGTYTVTVNATSGAQSANTTVSVIVQ
jgi:uncharacterized repeat protein (TIGR02543 family)